MTTALVLGALALVVLGVAKIVKWWNKPEVAKIRAARAAVRQQQRTERLKLKRVPKE